MGKVHVASKAKTDIREGSLLEGNLFGLRQMAPPPSALGKGTLLRRGAKLAWRSMGWGRTGKGQTSEKPGALITKKERGLWGLRTASAHILKVRSNFVRGSRGKRRPKLFKDAGEQRWRIKKTPCCEGPGTPRIEAYTLLGRKGFGAVIHKGGQAGANGKQNGETMKRSRVHN